VSPAASVPWLHVVAGDDTIARTDFLTVARSVIETIGANGALHLRSRATGARRLVALARRLLDASRSSGGWLVVNERLDVALVAGADGVQLGRTALAASTVRRIAPALRIGVSAHPGDEPPPGGSADWLIFGHVFDTPSHRAVPGVGVGALSEGVRTAGVPVLAIGGITPARVAAVLDAGAAGVAVSSGIWREGDPKRAADEYLSAYASRGSRDADRRYRKWDSSGDFRRHDTR